MKLGPGVQEVAYQFIQVVSPAQVDDLFPKPSGGEMPAVSESGIGAAAVLVRGQFEPAVVNGEPGAVDPDEVGPVPEVGGVQGLPVETAAAHVGAEF